MELENLRNITEGYRKQGKYNEVVEMYDRLKIGNTIKFDDWDKWRYAFSLRKVKRTKEALIISKKLYDRKPEFLQNTSLYSWCLYDFYINKKSEEIKMEESRFNKAAEFITTICKQEAFSPYEWTVMKVIDYYREKPSFPARFLSEWLDKLEPKALSSKIEKYKDKEGIERESESNKEKWYALKTKVLVKLEKYEEVIKAGMEALSEIDKFNHDNDYWIKNRIAAAKGKIGNKEEAIRELKKLLILKEEWFIQHELMQIYEELGNNEEAVAFAYDAALNGNEITLKPSLFEDMGALLKRLNKSELAGKHFLLSKLIRQENSWKVTKDLQDKIDALNINGQESTSAQEVYGQLKKEWLKARLEMLPSFNGTIKRIQQNGRAGFIMADNNKQYYFKLRSCMFSRSTVKEGLRVKFCTKTSFDMKKGVESEEAIYIRRLN